MDQRKQALIELSIRELEERHTLQRNSLYEFFKFSWKEEKGEDLDENRHIQQICWKLQAVFEGKIKRLIINIPPRSLKTEISKAFAVWCLGKKENIKLMSISYSADLTQKTSWEARNIYVSKAFRLCFPRAVWLREDQNTKQHWENEAGGQYYAAGSTWTITWVGADCISIDDPIKPSEAQSDVVRNSVNSNYHNTIKSRLNNKQEGAIVIIMQRLHDDDLCWHLMDLEDKWGEKWDKLIIPAIAEEDENDRRQWESFFEKRFPISILNEYKRENSIMFACQYQQNPVDKETQEFHEEWFRYHWAWGQDTPTNLRVFTTCDPAFKTGQENDNSCIMTGGFVGDKMYILEYTAWKWNADVLLDKIIYHIQKWSPEKVGIEAFQAQSMIVTFLKNELAKRGKYTTIEEIKQTGDKLSKLRKLIPLYRNWLIHHKYWMDELELELKRFPRGKHDDIIDAEQMLYDLYQIQPNSTTRTQEFKMEWDNYGRPIYNFTSDNMFDV